jgi:hypothetical protein
MKVPELKGGQMMTLAYFIGILVALFIVYRLLSKVGLVKTVAQQRTAAEETAAVEMLRTDEYFNPDYYKTQKYKQLGTNTALQYAKDLRDAMAGLGTDEESIFTTFGKLSNKAQISEIADQYRGLYGFPFYIKSDNLQADLLDELTKSETATLMNIINQLPNK